MKNVGRVQLVAYLSMAVVFGLVTFRAIMWSVWGAPVHAVHYIALLGTAPLFIGAFASLSSPATGRVLGLLGLAAMAPLWIPGVAALVPRHNVKISPEAYLLFLLYFVAWGFALLYPQPWKWSLRAFVIVLIVALGFAAFTTAGNVRRGEYARPSFAFFRWYPEGNTVITEGDRSGWIDAEATTLLERAGINGRLKWQGSSGERDNSHRVIVLAQSQIPAAHDLPYPRDGVLIYAYDGARWRKIPEDAQTYPAAATLEPHGTQTMLMQQVGGGRQGGGAFNW